MAQQLLHHDGHAADLVQAYHRIGAVRLEIADQRHAFADLLDALDGDRHLCLARDGEQVKIHIGRSAHRIDRGDGVLEGLLRHDVARTDAGFHQMVERIDRCLRLGAHVGMDVAARLVVGGMRGAARQHHAHRLGDRAHRVGGEHRAAGAAARHDVAFELEQFLARDTAGLVGGPAFDIVHDGEVVALGRPGAERDAAGRAGAGIEDQAEGVGAGERHQGGGAGLVAAGDHDHRVAVMGVVADLETVGYDVARHQAVAGRWCALRQRVGDCRRADDQSVSAALGQQLHQQVANGAHAVVAAMGVGIGTGDRYHGTGLRGFVGLETGGPELHARLLPVGAAVFFHVSSAGRRFSAVIFYANSSFTASAGTIPPSFGPPMPDAPPRRLAAGKSGRSLSSPLPTARPR